MTSFGRDYRLRFLLFALALATFAGCAEPQTPLFASKEHKFKVAFPAEPRVIEQPAGGLSSRLFTVDGPNGAYTVRVFDLPLAPDAIAAASDKLLDEAKADLLHSVSGTQTEGSSVTLAGKYPGRAVTATAPPPRAGVLRARIYLVGTRLYKVSVFGTADFANSDAATAFLESFATTS